MIEEMRICMEVPLCICVCVLGMQTEQFGGSGGLQQVGNTVIAVD